MTSTSTETSQLPAVGPDPVAPGPTRRRRRRWLRRVLIGANIFVALCIVAAAAGYAYFRVQFGRIPTVEGLSETLRNQGEDDPGQPMNVLLVGSDTRANLSPEEAESFGSAGQVGGQRADTIIILRADPVSERAAMLSIPRDLFVDIAGPKGSGKINGAFQDGPAQLIATLRESLGIEIDHYAQVDFNGFRGIVEAVGGVPVHFASPARDTVTGLDVPTAGCVTLDGFQALAYVRSRHYQYQEGGKWREDPTGDHGRITRQQDFIRRAMKKAIQRGARNPATLNALINTGVHNVTIDDAFTSSDILRLGKRFRSLEPEAVETIALPTVGGMVNGQSVLKLKQPEAQEVIDRFNGKAEEPPPAAVPEGAPEPVPDIAPNRIRVRVLNGSGVEGQATEASAALREAGFSVSGTGDADKFGYTRPVIRYGTGQRGKALVLGSMVAGAELEEDAGIRGIDLVLVTGSKFTIAAPGAGAAAADGGVDGSTAPSTTAKSDPKADAKAAEEAARRAQTQC